MNYEEKKLFQNMNLLYLLICTVSSICLSFSWEGRSL